MTSSNGNLFRVTGHLCGEFTGPRWIPHTKASDAELCGFLWSLNKRLSKQRWGWWFETPSCPLWRHRNGMNGVSHLGSTSWSWKKSTSLSESGITAYIATIHQVIPPCLRRKRDSEVYAENRTSHEWVWSNRVLPCLQANDSCSNTRENENPQHDSFNSPVGRFVKWRWSVSPIYSP